MTSNPIPRVLAAVLFAALAACTVGPDYAGPPATAPDAEHRARFLRAETGMTASEPQSAWWRGFNDPSLDAIVLAALAANTDIAAARARLSQARAQLGEYVANQGPIGSAGGGYSRTRPSFAQFGVNFPGVDLKDFDLYQANFDASWEMDLFGGQRRAVEAAMGAAKAASADIEDVRLSVAAETAEAYLQLRAQQSRLQLLTRSAGLDAQLIQLTESRQAEGTASTLDLERIRAQQEATLGEIPGVKAAITLQLGRLATLTAREPGAVDAELKQLNALPLPPAEVAIGDPAGLLRRRPDIRAAEQRLAADTAAIGVAMADLFPKVTLTGNIGLAANDLGKLPTGNAFIYSVGPSISWAVLDLGRVHARVDQADARREEALARYRGTVIGALNDAESGVTRYARQIETVAARQRALASAERAATLAEQRYHEGAASSLETLDADRQRLAADEQLLAAKAELSKAYVALQKSLGLAWAGDRA
ncbi:MAG: transporter [Rhodospirillales bacterium]|nr:transporter [Rhodospirillales bacterium]